MLLREMLTLSHQQCGNQSSSDKFLESRESLSPVASSLTTTPENITMPLSRYSSASSGSAAATNSNSPHHHYHNYQQPRQKQPPHQPTKTKSSSSSYQSLLLNSTPISPPKKYLSGKHQGPGIVSQSQKRERPFSAREYVERQKRVLMEKKRRQREAMRTSGAAFETDSASSSANGSATNRNNRPISSATREFNRQRKLKPPGVLRYDPFTEELERDQIHRKNHRRHLGVPSHLRVLNRDGEEDEEDTTWNQNGTGEETTDAANTPSSPASIRSPTSAAATGKQNSKTRKSHLKPLAQNAEYDHSPSILKSRMMLSMNQHAENPRLWVRSVLGSTLERGFYQVPTVELGNDPSSNLMNNDDYAEFLQIFDEEDNETYDDLVRDEQKMSSSRGAMGRVPPGGRRQQQQHEDDTSSTASHSTSASGKIKINSQLNIVTRPYSSIPKLDPNIELVRIESKRDELANRHMNHSRASSESGGTPRRKTFFDVDSEDAPEDSIHTGMDSDFLQSMGTNSHHPEGATTSLEALRKTSINAQTVKFDLQDSFPSTANGSDLHHKNSARNDFSYRPPPHDANTKTLETQFDELNLGKDLEEVVANIWAAPDRSEEIADSHKSLIESSISLRHKQEKARQEREHMDEYEHLYNELERVRNLGED